MFKDVSVKSPITCRAMCLSIILYSSLIFIEKAAFQLSLSFSIIHLIEKKTHFWNKNWFICSTLLSVVSSHLSIRYNQHLKSFTSCENEPFIGWKSNPTCRMRRSTVGNWILHVGNVWNKLNAPFFLENGRIKP